MTDPKIVEKGKAWRDRTPDWKEKLQKIGKEKSTGPRTKEGKLKSSLNSIIDLSRSDFFVKYLGCNKHPKVSHKDCPDCTHIRTVFIETLKSSKEKGFEKFHMAKLVSRLEADLSTSGKLDGRMDLEKAKLLKSTLESLHYMVYGRKAELTVNKKASIDELRREVFEVKDLNKDDENDKPDNQ